MAFSVIDIMLFGLFGVNILVALGSSASGQIMDDLNLSTAEDTPVFEINDSAYNQTISSVELSPKLSNLKGILDMFKQIFFAIPNVVADILTRLGMPATMVNIISVGLYSGFLVMYAILLVKLVSSLGRLFL